MTQPHPVLPLPGPPEHRQHLREILPRTPLAPIGDKWLELKVLGMLLGMCLVAPIFVLAGLVLEGLSAWSVAGAIATQVVGGVITLAWMVKATPRSHLIIELSKTMRGSFRLKFGVDPKIEDIEGVIKEFDKPAFTAGQHIADLLISKSPVKWSILLLIAALGVNIIPLLDTSIKAEDVNSLRLPAAALGLIFGLLEILRLIDRLLNERRLNGAREWLRQIQENIFPI